jgi:hypothetical protein
LCFLTDFKQQLRNPVFLGFKKPGFLPIKKPGFLPTGFLGFKKPGFLPTGFLAEETRFFANRVSAGANSARSPYRKP